MLRRLFFTTFSLSFFLLFGSFLSAEQDETDDIEYSVTVTADRLEEPLKEKSDSVTVIDREEIERHQWRYVSDALRDVAGIAIVQSGSAGKTTSAFIRGANSDQVLVLVDGIKTNDPYFGGISLQSLTSDNIERIEIVRGPQSTLYGSDSIGGVINIITRKGRGGIHPHLEMEAGAFQTFREKAGISGGTERVDYSLAFSRQDSEGQFDNDEFRENSVSGKGTIRLSTPTELSFTGRFHDSHVGIPFNALYLPSSLRNQDDRLAVFGTSLSHSTGKLLNATTRFSLSNNESTFEDPEDAFPFSTHNSDVLHAAFQNDFVLTSQNVLSAGFEFEHQSIDASDQNGSITDLNDYRSDIASVYIQNKFESNQWILTAGVRSDHYNTFGNTVNPRISAAYLPNTKWKIRGNFATGFRAPTAGDQFYPFYGNPELQPEESKSWEVGFDHSPADNLSVSAVWFHNTFTNLITFDPNTFLAANIAEATTKGLEITGSYTPGAWSVLVAYTYLDSRDDVENHRLFRRPTHTGSIRLSYDTNRWGSSVRVLGVGDRLEADFGVFPRVAGVESRDMCVPICRDTTSSHQV